MVTPSIGNTYRLDIPTKYRDHPIRWTDGGAKRRAIGYNGYVFWSDIDGNLVKITAKTHIITKTSSWVANLLKFPKYDFFVTNDFLMKETLRLPIQCGCDISLLMLRGCQCGAFIRELQKSKGKR